MKINLVVVRLPLLFFPAGGSDGFDVPSQVRFPYGVGETVAHRHHHANMAQAGNKQSVLAHERKRELQMAVMVNFNLFLQIFI